MRILLWHVHGSWTTAFVQGGHEYLLPTLPDGGPWGGGRAGRNWPAAVQEVPAADLVDTDVDVVVLQRQEEFRLATRWLRRIPGHDVPAIYVEHNTPKGGVPDTRHHLADQHEVTLVHVTHFNDLLWDCGTTPTTVIDHGVVDPGYRYTGDLPRAAVVINEPVRRWRTTGTDLLPRLAEGAELDVFGMGLRDLNRVLGISADRLHAVGDLGLDALHDALARRRVYLHPARWTSLGLSLIEAMHLGMPVVALAATEAVRAIPPQAGVLSTRVGDLADALRVLVAEPATAHRMGKCAREFALTHYGLDQFLQRWEDLLWHVASRPASIPGGSHAYRDGFRTRQPAGGAG